MNPNAERICHNLQGLNGHIALAAFNLTSAKRRWPAVVHAFSDARRVVSGYSEEFEAQEIWRKLFGELVVRPGFVKGAISERSNNDRCQSYGRTSSPRDEGLLVG